MKQHKLKNIRVLAIALSNRGFGFAVMEGKERLVDWGIKAVKRDKNAQCAAKIAELIAHYAPNVTVLENCAAQGSRRSPRIRELNEVIVCLASEKKVKAEIFSRKEVLRCFFGDETGTKHAIAKAISVRFSDELGTRLPPKRCAWMSQDCRMGIFDAVALALTFYMQNA